MGFEQQVQKHCAPLLARKNIITKFYISSRFIGNASIKESSIFDGESLPFRIKYIENTTFLKIDASPDA